MMRSCLHVFLGGLLLAGFMSVGGCNGARDTAINMVGENGERGFKIDTINNGGRERKYARFVPLNYDPKYKYPVIIFLHGLGEGGGDSRANLKVGLAPFVADRAGDFPFIVLFPQSPSGSWDENSEQASDVIAILEETCRRFNVDTDRVSLTGLSTGGYGTWAIGAKYKERFAALVPMGSSAGAPQYCEALVNMPIRSYHNNGDWAAAQWNDTSMVDRINMLGGRAEMYKTDGGGHNCWEYAYGETDLFEWLLSQRRRGPIGAR